MSWHNDGLEWEVVVMLRAVITLLWLGLALYAVLDCLNREPAEIRHLPRVLWLVLIVALPIAGAAAWLTVGVDRDGISRTPPARPRGPIGPDDDPDFLRTL